MVGEVNNELLESLIDVEELYQNAPCGYFSFLPNGTIVKINRTFLNWLGYAEEEIVLQKKFTDLISKGSVIYYEMVYLPLLKIQGQVNEINFDIIRKNGLCFPALINSAVIKDKTGELRAINVTVYDITDRKKYEKELFLAKSLAEAEKKRFEFLTNLIPEIIWTASPKGEIDYVNQRFYDYFGSETSGFSAEYLISRVYSADRKKTVRAWLACLKNGRDFHCEVRLQNKSDGYQWHLLRAMPYRESQGDITKWFGSCANIHDHVIALQRKDEFINIASHELKTPITSLKAYNQLLQRMESSDKVKDFVDKSATTLSNLHFLVSSLLDVSQINSGQLNLSLSTTSLSRVLKHSIELISLNYSSHQIVEEFDKTEDLLVTADPQRLTQVMINLLSNAIKYSPNSNKVVLKVTKNESRSVAKIEVIDFGLGIPAEKVDLVFNKYYRVTDTKNNNRVSGLGLGLYIIQNIVKLHGSRINVKSEVNFGSTFYFSLPITEES